MLDRRICPFMFSLCVISFPRNLPPTTAPCLYRWILLWLPMFVARRKLLSISRSRAKFNGVCILCNQSKLAVVTR